MPIDRKLWDNGLTRTWAPAWPCPRCRGSLALEKESFQHSFDSATDRYRANKDSDPTAYTGRFACLLKCSRSDCGEVCAVAGGFEVADDNQDYFEWCKPLSVSPPPPMILLPDGCPNSLKKETEAAYLLFWADNAACLNRIRNALELLLTDLKVARTYINDKNKRVAYSLHSRIEMLKKKRPKLAGICDRMMAVKHLGNAGSHSGEQVERKDVFDGFDILERVVHDMYSEHESELAKMVRQINKRKGPRRSK
jgi:Domain of unknown function (DUF4145)